MRTKTRTSHKSGNMKGDDDFKKIFREFTLSISFGWTGGRFAQPFQRFLSFSVGGGHHTPIFIYLYCNITCTIFLHMKSIHASTNPLRLTAVVQFQTRARLLTTKNHPRRDAHEREPNRHPRTHDERLTHLRPHTDASSFFVDVLLANVVEVVRFRAGNTDGGCLICRFVPPIVPTLTLVIHPRPRRRQRVVVFSVVILRRRERSRSDCGRGLVK